MVWHHCYISLPYAAVYLTLWRTVVGFAPSQRRSKRFDSPTIRAPICRNPWQACLSAPDLTGAGLPCQRPRRRRNPYPASALEEGRNPRQVRLARKSKRDSQGESLGVEELEKAAALSRIPGANPAGIHYCSCGRPCCNPSMPIHPASMPPINLRTIHE